ncbi:MAG: hypothetical protein ACLGHO_12195 [Gammaproteobacteria bacterium]
MDAALLQHQRLARVRAAFRFALLLLVLDFHAHAHAAAIGAVPSPEGLRLGVLAGLARADVDDPAGDTDTKNYSRVALIGTLAAAKDRRWFGEAFYHRFDIDAGRDSIGVDVTRLGAALSYQARFATLPRKPWLGAGLSLSRDSFTERLTVDALGFVNNRFPEHSDTAIALVLNAMTTWKWTPTTDFGLQLQYEQPLTGDIKTLTLGALLIF